jgi:threonine dehydratase
VILRTLDAAGPAHEGSEDFLPEALRCKQAYEKWWKRCAIREAESLGRSKVFLVDDTGQELGAFKIRGATVSVHEAARTRDGELRGVCAASSGSLGMAVARTAANLRLTCTIFVPAGAAPEKKEKIRSLGAKLDDSQPTFEAAKEKARRFEAEEPSTKFIDGAAWENFKGNASLAAEIAESGLLSAGRSAVVVPLGVGGLAVPTGLFFQATGRDCDLLVVEPAEYCKFLASRSGGPEPRFASTIADGAAIARLPDLSRRLLDRVARGAAALTEQEIVAGMRFLWHRYRLRCEGAAALAAGTYLADPRRFDDYDQVWLVVTGRNIDDARFEALVKSPGALETA